VIRLFPIVFLTVLSSAHAAAQLVPLAEGGARSLALGRATVALADDVWGHYNPGAWATLTESTAGLFASQAFGMPEFRVVAAAVAYPTPYGVATGTARAYGFEDFRESLIGVGFGRAIRLSPTRHLRAGVALRHTSVAIPEFGSAGTLGLSAGVMVDVVPHLTFGAHVLNVNRPNLSSLDPLETRLDAGIAYRAHPQGLLLLAVSKDVDYPMSFRGGVEVQPVEVLLVRAGFGTEPARFSGGIGVVVSSISASVAAEHHYVMGWTPAFEFAVRW
jgi:hypothetical protein